MAQAERRSLLRQLREERGLSLREAARDLELDPSFLLRLERGERSASRQIQQRAADYYAVEADLLLLENGDVPEDVVAILRDHPEVLTRLRKRYG